MLQESSLPLINLRVQDLISEFEYLQAFLDIVSGAYSGDLNLSKDCPVSSSDLCGYLLLKMVEEMKQFRDSLDAISSDIEEDLTEMLVFIWLEDQIDCVD